MTSTAEDDPHNRNFRELCNYIGLALVTWQQVEDSHRKIFLQMLNVPLSEVSSVVYYSTESFDARHRMLHRMASYFLVGKQLKHQRRVWQELQKEIKNANENRNKLAHYGADYDLINRRDLADGGVSFEVTPHTLRPARWNFVSQLLGRTQDNPEHNIGVEDIKRYIISFRQLSSRMDLFHVSLSESEAASQPNCRKR